MPVRGPPSHAPPLAPSRLLWLLLWYAGACLWDDDCQQEEFCIMPVSCNNGLISL